MLVVLGVKEDTTDTDGVVENKGVSVGDIEVVKETVEDVDEVRVFPRL